MFLFYLEILEALTRARTRGEVNIPSLIPANFERELRVFVVGSRSVNVDETGENCFSPDS